jgi:hypothetical protein
MPARIVAICSGKILYLRVVFLQAGFKSNRGDAENAETDAEKINQ